MSPENGLVIPLFFLLEEKKDNEKKNEGIGTNRSEEEEIQETSLLDPIQFPLDGMRKIGLEERKFGMTQQVGEISGKCLPITVGKPLLYRPPLLANKGRVAR